jgi:putative ABC transport system permease protein
MTLLKTGLRYLIRRPLLSLLCILGVALGVAVVIAIDLANESASRAFNLSTETVAGRATHQVVSGSGRIDEALYRTIKVDLGVRNAAPVVEAFAIAVDLDQQPVRVLGVDVFAEGPFRSYLGEGTRAFTENDLAAFFTQPDALLIGDALAQRYALKAGDALNLRIGDRRVSMRIAGVIRTTDENSRRALDGLAIADLSTAQQLFGMQGALSHIDLIADDRTPEGRATLDRVRPILPPDTSIEKPRQRSQSIESLSDAFRLNLTALSLLALVVGMFLIYNTITFSVVQRRPIIGTLRCLGVTQREIFRLMLSEMLILAAIGGLLGVGLGIVLGRGAIALVTQTINDLYYVVNVRDVSIPPLTLLKGFVLGVVASLVAALGPAYEATSIPPITALKRTVVEQRVHRLLPYVAAAGLLLFVIGCLLLLATAVLVVNLAGIFFVLIGVALLAPLLTVWLMRLLSPLLGRSGGLIGRMAPRNVNNAISRTAIAIAALMVAVSVIIGLQSMIGSFRKTVETWLDTSLTADVYIAPVPTGSSTSNLAMDDALVAQFKTQPDVADVTLLRRVNAEFQIGAGGWRTGALQSVGSDRERPPGTHVWSARSETGLWASMRDRDEIQVSEPFANKNGITRANNTVKLRTPSGERVFTVVSVFYDYSSDAGVMLMRREQYARYFNDNATSSIAVYLNEGASAAAAAVSYRKTFAGRELLISANRELRDNALVVFDRTFAITGALNLLATVVAFIGVLSALMALQIERTRELGMLRANGMTLPQLWKLTLLETGLMGGTAGLLAIPTGILLAVVLVYVINLRSFGWTIQLNLAGSTFVQAMLVALGSALLAAIYPMLRLGKLQIASAVRQE